MITKADLKGLRYYLALCGVVFVFHVYSMFTGLRYMSFGESTHSKERTTGNRTYIHRNTFYHK